MPLFSPVLHLIFQSYQVLFICSFQRQYQNSLVKVVCVYVCDTSLAVSDSLQPMDMNVSF